MSGLRLSALHVAHTALHVQVSRVIRCAFGVWYREPDYSSLAHQFVTLCHLVCGSAGVARRHASSTSSLVTALVTCRCRFCGTSTK